VTESHLLKRGSWPAKGVRRRLLVALAVLLSGLTTTWSAANAEPPIQVKVCDPQPPSVTVPGFVAGYYPLGPYYFSDVYGFQVLEPAMTGNPTLSIDYVNISDRIANTVEFGLVARGHLVAEVRDVGTFSPGVDIKHTFGLSPNVYPLGTGLPLCRPLRVKFADGTLWVNPHLPALERSLYR
jgi:hypothetical protein